MTKPTLPKNFCVAPFIQITTHPSGSFSPCPYLGGTTWNDDSGSILAKWRSQDIESLRGSFLADQKSPICQRCWDEESSNKRSLRLRMLDPTSMHSDYGLLQDTDRLHDILAAIQDGSYIKSPKIISIKNGNVCNAKCRSCHPEDSTPWIQDVDKLYQQKKGRFFSLTSQNSYRTGIREINWSEQQVQDLQSMLPSIMRLELFGGEPLYNKKVRQLLNSAIDHGHSRHISLYINTNGSVDFLEKIPGIDQFQDLDIGVSIDAIPKHFSYVRHPLEFAVISKNIEKWLTFFRDSSTPFKIQSISTVSILNAYYLPELRATVEKMLGQIPFWNLLVYPQHLNIQTLPQEIKDIVAEKLEKHQGFDDLIDFMYSRPSDEKNLRDFFDLRDSLDAIRGEVFINTFGTYAEMLENHRPAPAQITIFIGDLAQPHAGKYLEYMTRKHGDDLCHRISDDDHGVCITEVDGVQHQLPMDSVPTGYYYTGVTEWRDLGKLKSLLDVCARVYYAPPSFWSDGAESFTTLMPPRGWSRVVTEELLQDVVDYVTIDPNS